VDLIENSIIELLDGYGIVAATRKGAPGVYVDEKKIAALGLRIKQGCSYHGLSLNVDMDLEPFSYINPCGYPGMSVTQLRELLEEPQENLFEDVQARLQSILSRPLL
jgi:lipoyl(octanoyl) transferase